MLVAVLFLFFHQKVEWSRVKFLKQLQTVVRNLFISLRQELIGGDLPKKRTKNLLHFVF